MDKRKEKQNKYKKMLASVRNYDDQADIMKKELFNKFNKNQLFELVLAYQAMVKYFAYELVYPGDKDKAMKLLTTASESVILGARERFEKDGKVRKVREELEDNLSPTE
jgi:hypothetical protein